MGEGICLDGSQYLPGRESGDDPETNANAVRYDTITYAEAVRENLQFMDQAAIAVCRENALPIIVFDMTVPGNIRKVVAGEAIGTRVSG